MKCSLFSFLFLFSLAVYTEAQAPRYNGALLPTNTLPDLQDIIPMSINNLGEVVGVWWSSKIIPQGFLYSNGTTMNLGTFGGEDCYANDINDLGQIVGEVSLASGPKVFLYSQKEGVKYLNGSYANAINNAGQIAGSNNYGSPVIILPNGTNIEIEYTSYGFSSHVGGQAIDINDNYTSNGVGQVAGLFEEIGSFLYSDGVESLISKSGEVYGINNPGQIIGGYGQFQQTVGYIYFSSSGQTYDFKDNAVPRCINDFGWIAGVVYDYTDTNPYPFLLIGETMYNLKDLVNEYLSSDFEPVAINNQGMIIGKNSPENVMLLTPVQTD